MSSEAQFNTPNPKKSQKETMSHIPRMSKIKIATMSEMTGKLLKSSSSFVINKQKGQPEDGKVRTIKDSIRGEIGIVRPAENSDLTNIKNLYRKLKRQNIQIGDDERHIKEGQSASDSETDNIPSRKKNKSKSKSPEKLVLEANEEGGGYELASAAKEVKSSLLDLEHDSPTDVERQRMRKDRYLNKRPREHMSELKMMRVEEKIFCSDWQRAEQILSFDDHKIGKLLRTRIKTIDDIGKYTLFESIINTEFDTSLDHVGGSFLEFGFEGKVHEAILESQGFAFHVFDVEQMKYASFYCKPSLTKKTIFLDDVGDRS